MNKKYHKTRKCSTCNKELFYSCISSYNLAEKNKQKCRSCATVLYAKRKADCSFLLEESLEKYYWLGFIIADGHISKNNRLKITLAIKDTEHLEKLAKRLKTKITITKNVQCSLTAMNRKILSQLKKEYKIKHNKTQNPCDISNITGDNLEAFKIGFIDGDGNIISTGGKNSERKDFQIRIKCHKSWKDNLEYMFGKAYINSQGYALSCISNTVESKKLKQFAVENNLPFLERKWKNINLNYISRCETASLRVKKYLELKQQNKTNKYIADKLGISESGLYMLKRRNNLI